MSEPLTDSELAAIADEHGHGYGCTCYTRLLASERAWQARYEVLRAAVAALLNGPKLAAGTYANEPVYSADGDLRCVFCNAYVAEGDAHEPDCPYAALRAHVPPAGEA